MMLKRINRGILYLVLAVFAVIYLMPIYVVLTTSFKSDAEVNLAHMWWLPQHFDLAGYAQAWQQLQPNFVNSVELGVFSTLFSALLGSLNGYALSKWKFRGANVLFPLILFGMFIPYQSVLLPLIKFTESIGVYNTIPGLIFVNVIYGIPICTLIFRNYYAGIPNDLIEAGRIDGTGYWGIYRHIIGPLSIPAFVVVGIWQFTSVWNEFLFAVTLTSPPHQPVMVALQNLAGSQIVHWNVQMAGAFMAALPTLLVYVLLGRYFIRGLLAGSVKG